METNKVKEFKKLIVKQVHEAETLEEWQEKVKFAAGFY